MGGALRDDETKEEKFTLQDGASQLVPMMRQWGNFRYAERGGAQIVSLPYKGGMSMRVVLPPKQMPFPKFCAELTSIVGTSWTRAIGERDATFGCRASASRPKPTWAAR